MDDDSRFFDYGIGSQSDSNYQWFGGSEVLGQHSPRLTLEALPHPGHVQSEMPPSSNTLMQPPPLTRSYLPTRASAQSDLDRYSIPSGPHRMQLSSAPTFDKITLASPALTSGSSNTPETRVSGQDFTPTTTPPDVIGRPIQPAKPPDALFPPPAPLPPRRRRPRRPRPKPQLSAAEEDAKREKFLERNRVAAGKCRVKRKSRMTDLEVTKLDLEKQNSKLRMEHAALLNEASQARAMLMGHASCNDYRIDKWIENEAKRFVLGTGEQYDTLLANYGVANAPPSRHESMSSISEYTTSATNDMMSPTRRVSTSVSSHISSSNRGSISLPQGMGIPASPVFLQTQGPSDRSAAPVPLINSAYTLSPTSQIEDSMTPARFESIPRSMM